MVWPQILFIDRFVHLFIDPIFAVTLVKISKRNRPPNFWIRSLTLNCLRRCCNNSLVTLWQFHFNSITLDFNFCYILDVLEVLLWFCTNELKLELGHYFCCLSFVSRAVPVRVCKLWGDKKTFCLGWQYSLGRWTQLSTSICHFNV